LKPVEGNDDVRFCTVCRHFVAHFYSGGFLSSIGSEGFCPAQAGPPRPRFARAQFLVAWEPRRRQEQLRYLLDLLGADPMFREGFSAPRSGVRYEFTIRNPNPEAWLAGLQHLIRPEGIALRINPPADP
jgi:hypothetical protein